ncbi:hypothetical protein RAG34_11835 [Klebsiella pneumoniae]
MSEYKSQGMKSRDARAQAKQDIADERTQVQERQGDLQQELEKHIQASRAEYELGQIDRGDIPPALRERIAARAAEIGDGFKPTAIAQGVRTAAQRINEANWTQRENAFRGGLSHMLQGRTPDIEPFFDLGRTDLRAAAFDQIKQGPRPDIDEPTVRASADAETQYKRAQNNDDLMNAQEDFDAEIELARNMVDDLDSPQLKEALSAIQKEANDESFMKGLQAYATCMLRRM